MLSYSDIQEVAHRHSLTVVQMDHGNPHEYLIRGGQHNIELFLGKPNAEGMKMFHYYQAHGARSAYPHPHKAGVMVPPFIGTGRRGAATMDIEEAITAGLLAVPFKVPVLHRHERRQVVLALHDEQGRKCYYCQKIVTIAEATGDHLVPLSRGGMDAKINIAMACLSCNQEKGNLTAAEFLAKKGKLPC